MTKDEFMEELRSSLRAEGVPSAEIDRALEYYAEAIDDRIEDGVTEDDAVQTLGPTSCIVKECVSSIPPVQRSLLKLTTGNRVLDTLLVVVTAPVWVPATLAVVTTVLSIIASLWMFVAFLWLVVLAGFATGLLGVIFLVRAVLWLLVSMRGASVLSSWV